jgi:hypothetical protein
MIARESEKMKEEDVGIKNEGAYDNGAQFSK